MKRIEYFDSSQMETLHPLRGTSTSPCLVCPVVSWIGPCPLAPHDSPGTCLPTHPSLRAWPLVVGSEGPVLCEG